MASDHSRPLSPAKPAAGPGFPDVEPPIRAPDIRYQIKLRGGQLGHAGSLYFHRVIFRVSRGH